MGLVERSHIDTIRATDLAGDEALDSEIKAHDIKQTERILPSQLSQAKIVQSQLEKKQAKEISTGRMTRNSKHVSSVGSTTRAKSKKKAKQETTAAPPLTDQKSSSSKLKSKKKDDHTSSRKSLN